jgi:hypothetical protein
MSITPTLSQLVQSLRQVLPQVNSQTTLDDQLEAKPCREWLSMAEAARTAFQQVTPEFVQLEQLELALLYRTHQIASEPAAQLEVSLVEKFQQGIPPKFAQKQLEYLCSTYSAFAQMLLSPYHEELAANFYKFCLQAPSLSSHREKSVTHWIDIFIKYPEVAQRLMRSPLYEKLGYFPETINIDEGRGVCLKMELWDEVQWVPINLTKENLKADLYLRNRAPGPPRKLTLEQLFHQFETDPAADLDISMNGIINLNTYLLGSRNSTGVLDLINPAEWTNQKPYVELELSELKIFYPEVKNDPPYGFVLRSSRLHSRPFFDLVIRKDAKYRVISLNGPQESHAVLQQQKMVFYPLEKEQGEEVVRMVEKDILKYRSLAANGNLASYLDVQLYIDEILGKDFYALIRELAYTALEKETADRRLARIKTNLNPDAFEQFMQPVIAQLIEKRDIPNIHRLITTSLTTLLTVLQRDKAALPSREEVDLAFTNLFRDKQIYKINQSLLALTRLCFDVLHPYSMTVAEFEQETPVLGHIFRAVEAIPWLWLKTLLNNSLLVLLGPFRGYRYPTMETPRQRSYANTMQVIRNLKPENYLNGSAQLMKSCSKESIDQVDCRIQGQLSVLTAVL